MCVVCLFFLRSLSDFLRAVIRNYVENVSGKAWGINQHRVKILLRFALRGAATMYSTWSALPPSSLHGHWTDPSVSTSNQSLRLQEGWRQMIDLKSPMISGQKLLFLIHHFFCVVLASGTHRDLYVSVSVMKGVCHHTQIETYGKQINYFCRK